MRKVYVSFPRKYDKEEFILVRVPTKKRQKRVKVNWEKS